MRTPLAALLAGLATILGVCLGNVATAAPLEQNGIWGAWQVEIKPQGRDAKTSQVSIWPRLQTACLQTARGHCIFRWVPADEPGFEAHGSPGHQNSYRAPSVAAVVPGIMNIEHRYWHNTFYSEYLTGNGDSFSGVYARDGGLLGTSTWRRLPVRIDRIEVSPLGRGWYKQGGTSFAPTARLRAEGVFEKDHLSDANTMRGNRPTFSLRIFGENVASLQAVEMPFSPGYEPFNPQLMTDQAGEVWLRMEFALWTGATPGIKRLLINGEEHEIEIVLDGYVRGSEQDRCGPAYFEQLKQLANARLDRFERETAHVAGPDPAFRNFKENPYVRSGNVSYDEDLQIRAIEAVVSGAVAQKGPDQWLYETRRHLLMRYRFLVEAYLAAETRGSGCLVLTDFHELNSRIHQRIGEITHPRLRDHKLMAASSSELARKFGKIVRQKLYEVNVNWLDLARGKALTFEQTEALRLSMRKVQHRVLETAHAGGRMTQEQTLALIRQAYVDAGIPANLIPSPQISELTPVESGWVSWLVQSWFDEMADTTQLSRLGSFAASGLGVWGLVSSMSDITFGLVDYGTLQGVSDADMPLALALMQNAAHMENLVWRYSVFLTQVRELDEDLLAML